MVLQYRPTFNVSKLYASQWDVPTEVRIWKQGTTQFLPDNTKKLISSMQLGNFLKMVQRF